MKVPKLQGQKTIVLADRLKLFDKELEIQKDEAFLYIPLLKQPSKSTLESFRKGGIDFEILNQRFIQRNKEPKLHEQLKSLLPPRLLAKLPHATDFVGEIAIIEIPSELEPYQKIVGQAIMKVHKNVRTVLAKAGAVSGTYRLREFNVIAGEHSTETIHKESGCQFKVDVAKAYFSPRLSNEHKRIASLVQEGETIIDSFSGVGPFAIFIAKTHEKVQIYAVDANPDAVDYLKFNIRLNKVMDKIHVLSGDAHQILNERLMGIADRIIMNLPETAIEFVEAACTALKPSGGFIHFYSFIDASSSIEEKKLEFKKKVEESGRTVGAFFSSKTVRETAPREWQVVIDAQIL
jgi:tRNA (guanine37-N1)-methyltransferase